MIWYKWRDKNDTYTCYASAASSAWAAFQPFSQPWLPCWLSCPWISVFDGSCIPLLQPECSLSGASGRDLQQAQIHSCVCCYSVSHIMITFISTISISSISFLPDYYIIITSITHFVTAIEALLLHIITSIITYYYLCHW